MMYNDSNRHRRTLAYILAPSGENEPGAKPVYEDMKLLFKRSSSTNTNEGSNAKVMRGFTKVIKRRIILL
ncbi:hypothetical protein [Aquimarina algiphila]|uniref:hypothetical protein n=1 Tax=Aquimarina algiphila TaxID=2047982 RepID=UPI002330911A|nr:hypothetical protein [Aquimarina algiphila]